MLTKSLTLALERVHDLLPIIELTRKPRAASATGEGDDETKALWYMRYARPHHPEKPEMSLYGSTAQCLCHAVTAAIEPISKGGFGKTLEEVQEKLGLARIPKRGLGAHQEDLLNRLVRIPVSLEAVQQMRPGASPVRTTRTRKGNMAVTTKKRARKGTSTATKAPIKKVAAKRERKPRGEAKGPVWTFGVFWSPSRAGRIVSCHCGVDGKPRPFEEKRTQGAKIIYHNSYSGMTSAEARKRLYDEAGKKDPKVAAAIAAQEAGEPAPNGAAPKQGKARKAAATKKAPAKAPAKSTRKRAAKKGKAAQVPVTAEAEAAEPAEAEEVAAE